MIGIDSWGKWTCEDGKVYTEAPSLFGYEDSIWTFNCPCPFGLGCLKNHICRFKQNNAGKVLNKDCFVAKQLSDDFETLGKLFSGHRRGPVKMVEKEQQKEVFTQYTDFKCLLDDMGIQLRTRSCRHQENCFTPNCSFAHSMAEMIESFDDTRVRHFYKNDAKIRSLSHKPKRYLLQDKDRFACTGTRKCSNEIASIQIQAFDFLSGELVYPYCIVRCNHCKKSTRVAIYV